MNIFENHKQKFELSNVTNPKTSFLLYLFCLDIISYNYVMCERNGLLKIFSILHSQLLVGNSTGYNVI